MALNLKDLASQIQGAHMVLATLTKQPAFVLSQNECQMMAQAIINVCNEYDIRVTGGKLLAWVTLVGTLGMVYIPRAAQLRAKRNPPQSSEAEPVQTELDLMGQFL